MGVDDRDSISRNGEVVDARLVERCIDPPTWRASDCSYRGVDAEAVDDGFQPSAVRIERGGLSADRVSIARSRCLPLPRVASGRLGRSQSAATFNPTVPDSGRFLRRLVERPLEASSTRL